MSCGIRFDYGHFWEDICFKNGPLVNPRWFAAKVAPHYRRVTRLLNDHGVSIVSLDCDGKIDKLIPAWLENGVNTMFPIEVGTWDASIAPWRAQYGRTCAGSAGWTSGCSPGPRGGRRGDRTAAAAGGAGRLHPLPGPPHRAGRQMGERAVLLRAHARDVLNVTSPGIVAMTLIALSRSHTS